MSNGNDEWHVSRGGQIFGPVSFDEVVKAAQAGRIEPRTDMLFGGDLTDWLPAGEVDGVFEKAAPSAPEAAAAAAAPDSHSMAATGDFDFDEERPVPTQLDLPGARRLGYFFGVTLLPGVLVVGLSKVIPAVIDMLGPDYGPYAVFLLLLVPLVIFVVTLKRFQNLAMTGWWIVGLLVPLLQYWVQYRLLCCPPGYALTKKLDIPGKIMATLYWLGLVGSVAIMILYGAAIAKNAEEESVKERVQEVRNLVDGWIDEAKKTQKKDDER